jgi:hypothetical protein
LGRRGNSALRGAAAASGIIMRRRAQMMKTQASPAFGSNFTRNHHTPPAAAQLSHALAAFAAA